MPWETLELGEDASERDIKRAYARLLKQHRPDRDPEGFARINAAYEQAKYELSLRVGQPGHGQLPSRVVGDDQRLIHDESSEAARAFVRKKYSDAFGECREGLLKAIADGDAEGVREGLYQLSKLSIDRPDCISQWGEIIGEVFSDRLSLLASMMPIKDLLREMEFGSDTATQAVISGWVEDFDTKRMSDLAEAMLHKPGRHGNESVARVSVRLADLLAIVDPKRAEMLANQAFGNLPPASRDWILESLERSLLVGNLFKTFSVDHRRFWAQRLSMLDRDWDWNTPESVAAIEFLDDWVEPDWRGYGLIGSVVPADRWEAIDVCRASSGWRNNLEIVGIFVDTLRLWQN